MSVNLKFSDRDGLGEKLQRLSKLSWEVICEKNALQMYQRGQSNTPVDTGELRRSMTHSPMDTVGYVADYAAHVEFGHRVGKDGYVEGQRYLQSNVKKQEPIFKHDLLEAIEKA